MKMKELVESTGLSDRTIRYYMDTELFVPERYSENYEGRKKYNFSDNDVRQLQQIITLRKYDFSIEEIKRIKEDMSDISSILQIKIEKLKSDEIDNKRKVKMLEMAEHKSPETMEELTDMLSEKTFENDTFSIIDEHQGQKLRTKAVKKKAKIAVAVFVAVVTVALFFLFCVYHITWEREQVSFSYTPKSAVAAKEKYGGSGENPDNAILLPDREITIINIKQFPWDSKKTCENKIGILKETQDIAIKYYSDFDLGPGPGFDMEYKFLMGTPNSITYKLYGEPGGTAYIVTVKLKKDSYDVKYYTESK
ncbi:MAG: MerR family transcriptional regulator [Clostridiales bacterium]|nr:MerR family transcriptional regulator [Clostridiales bacterium]